MEPDSFHIDSDDSKGASAKQALTKMSSKGEYVKKRQTVRKMVDIESVSSKYQCTAAYRQILYQNIIILDPSLSGECKLL